MPKNRPPLPQDIKELMALVRAGKLFAVQKWISAGKRTVPPEPYWFSPLRIAVEKGFHSMVEVLLKAGVDQDEKDYLLDRAVSDANFDLIKLLIEYGADLHSVRFEDVCRTGNPEIIRFFVDSGLDVLTGDPFAHALCYPNRSLLGIYMRYRKQIPDWERQLNLALRHHVQTGNLKWISLLLWAGGNPRLRLPDVGQKPDPENDTSALELAVRFNRDEIVEKIGIDPKKDDLNRLLQKACSSGNVALMDKLIALGADPNRKTNDFSPMRRAMWGVWFAMEKRYGFRSETKVLEALVPVYELAEHGARWNPDTSDLRRFRRELYGFGRISLSKP